MHRHQPAGILRVGIEVVDTFERLLERGKNCADRVDFCARGRGQGRACR